MGETAPMIASERERAAWTERADVYAREAAAKNQPFAAALVEFANLRPGDRVLDVATGPGIVAVEAAKRVEPAGSVLATDFIPVWEPYVRATAGRAGVRNVTFQAMPAEALDLPDASFDAVLCQFGLMFMPRPVAALREMRRVLRRGGTLAVAVWSVPEKVGLFLVSRIIGAALPPPEGDAPPSPMGMGEPGLLERLVAEAGFREITRETRTFAHEVTDPEAEWRRVAEMPASPAARGLATLPPAEQDRLHREAIAALETMRDGEVIRLPSEAILVRAIT